MKLACIVASWATAQCADVMEMQQGFAQPIQQQQMEQQFAQPAVDPAMMAQFQQQQQQQQQQVPQQMMYQGARPAAPEMMEQIQQPANMQFVEQQPAVVTQFVQAAAPAQPSQPFGMGVVSDDTLTDGTPDSRATHKTGGSNESLNNMIIWWTNLMAWNFYIELWIGVGKDVAHVKEHGSTAAGGILGLISGGLSGLAGGAAGGAPHAAGAATGKTFDQIDANHDGQISLTEARDAGISAQQFQQMDLNKDGVVSRSEFAAQQGVAHQQGAAAGGQQLTDQSFQQIDTNHDGKITRDEAQQAGISGEQFTKADTNGDNVIDRKEFAEAQANSKSMSLEREPAASADTVASIVAAVMKQLKEEHADVHESTFLQLESEAHAEATAEMGLTRFGQSPQTQSSMANVQDSWNIRYIDAIESFFDHNGLWCLYIALRLGEVQLINDATQHITVADAGLQGLRDWKTFIRYTMTRLFYRWINYQLPADSMKMAAYNYDVIEEHKKQAGTVEEQKFVPAFNLQEASAALAYYAVNTQLMAFGAWAHLNHINFMIFHKENTLSASKAWDTQKSTRYGILMCDFGLVNMGFAWTMLAYSSQFKPHELVNPVTSGLTKVKGIFGMIFFYKNWLSMYKMSDAKTNGYGKKLALK